MAIAPLHDGRPIGFVRGSFVYADPSFINLFRDISVEVNTVAEASASMSPLLASYSNDAPVAITATYSQQRPAVALASYSQAGSQARLASY